MANLCLCLGSNLNNRIQYLKQAEKAVNEIIGNIHLESNYYESEAWGLPGSLLNAEKAFINKVVIVKTKLLPHEILTNIHKIEAKLGRVRVPNIPYTNRTIDIDILYYDQLIMHDENLQIPHPKIQERRFVLVPLNEIAPHFIHPGLKKTCLQLLSECTDNLMVNIYQEP